MADTSGRRSDDNTHTHLGQELEIDLKGVDNNRPVEAYKSGTDLAYIASHHSQRFGSPASRHTTRSFGDGYGISHSVKDQQQGQSSTMEDKTFEVDFDENDVMNPKNKPHLQKWLIVILLALASFCVTNTSSVYTLVYDQMDVEFGNSRIVATLGLTTFVFGLGLGPMFVAPLSEFYGRRPIYLVSLFFFVIWLIPCAFATNIETMIIVRFLDGFAGSAFLSVAGGTVGDMFTTEMLQEPMLVYSAAPLLGPSSGPLIGGFINYYLNWRWSFYILLIWGGGILMAIVFFVPETYAPVLLREKAKKKRKQTGDNHWKAPIEVMERSVFWTVVRSLYRPFLLLTLEPMCSNLCLFSAILLGILYLFFGAFRIVFTEVYNFNLWQVGCSFLGIFVGMLLCIASNPIWHRIYLRLLDKQEQKTGERTSEPEFRLPDAIVGAWLCVIGMFWFAWTTYSSIHWIVPIIGTAFFGCGVLLVFTGIFTFLVEAYPLYAASALAANSFARSSFAAAFPLFGNQMYDKLGIHWASTLLAFLTLAMAPFPYLFFVYGKQIRARSKYGSA